MKLPNDSYLVCASQRSGTTMLCRALAGTGVAGRPEEYFLSVQDDDYRGWGFWEKGILGVAHGATDRESYLEIVYRLATTPNGTFGAKLMWNNVRWAVAKFQEMPRFSGLSRAEVFHAAFPNLRVVNVTRRDRVRQAVSWARMAQEGVWVVSDDEPAAPTGEARYDYALIRALEDLIVEGERGWRDFYAELGIEPYEVVYEDFADAGGWERTVRGVLDHLGLDGGAVTVPAPRTHRQADALNAAWVERYRAERDTR